MKETILADRNVVLFGATGQIGSAIIRRLINMNLFSERIFTPRWSEIAGKSPENILEPIFHEADDRTKFDIIFANGITNPKEKKNNILYSNLIFPKAIIRASIDKTGIRYMTLGTIQECFPKACNHNPYLFSKLELGSWVKETANRPGGQGRLLHLRLHTVYSDSLIPHMFIGQIAQSIKSGSRFFMSQGTQLREYHHADDISSSIVSILSRDWNFGPVIEINSGRPLRLADLARHIFRAFDKEELLSVGALETPMGENTDQIFEPSASWLLPETREPVDGVVKSIKKML